MKHPDQTVGHVVSNWIAPRLPTHTIMQGRLCRLEPLDEKRHACSLYAAYAPDTTGSCWTYLPYGPFANFESYRAWLVHVAAGTDPQFYAIIDLVKGEAVGVASYLRIDPANGSIEVGHLNFSPLLQRTPAATEAMFLMMTRAFESGYRRYEWKCNALNIPSRKAALRLGFSHEGVFRQAAVVKGRNRDTAWYAAIDLEWPALKQVYQQWLSPDNFDEAGRQKLALSTLTAPILNRADI